MTFAVETKRALLVGVFSVLCGGLVAGCGYTLAGRGSFLPASIRTVGIPTFTNKTTVFNLETLLSEKVRSEFIGRGKYRVLPQDTGVDAVLIGNVASVTVAPTSFNAAQLASRYVITMTASVQFRDVKENKVLWSNPSLTFRQEYEASTSTTGSTAIDANAFLSQEASALERVSTEFARTIVSSILEAF
jgi:hypothetical protein